MGHITTIVGLGERDALAALQVRLQRGVFEV